LATWIGLLPGINDHRQSFPVLPALTPSVECIDKTTGLRARGEQSVSEIDYAVKEITGASAPHFSGGPCSERPTEGCTAGFFVHTDGDLQLRKYSLKPVTMMFASLSL
jgi:hypothetical protein